MKAASFVVRSWRLAAVGLVLGSGPRLVGEAIASGGPIGSGPSLLCANGLAINPAGDLFLVDGCGDAVMRVDPLTGNRIVVSDATNGGGEPFDRPWAVVVEGSGTLLVTDSGRKAVLRVDPATGDRTLVSARRLRGSGQGLFTPGPIAIEAGGTALVGEFGFPVCLAFPSDCYIVQKAVIRVDPATGDRTVLSGGGLLSRRIGRGPTFLAPRGLAVEPSGAVVVAAGNRGTLRVDPVTGDRSVLSEEVGWVAVDQGGSLVATDDTEVVRIDPATGARTIVSGPTRGTGPLFLAAKEIAVAPDGSLAVLDGAGGTADRSIIRVDPVSGDRTYISR